jgi:hypothetical protein
MLAEICSGNFTAMKSTIQLRFIESRAAKSSLREGRSSLARVQRRGGGSADNWSQISDNKSTKS